MTREKVTAYLPPEAVERVKKYMLEHKGVSQSEALIALLAPETQIEVIRSSPEQANRHKDKMEEVSKMDEFDEKHHQRRMREIAAEAKPIPQDSKVDWGAGHSGVETSTKINSPKDDYRATEEPKEYFQAVAQEDWAHNSRHLNYIAKHPERANWTFDDWVKHDKGAKQ